MRIFIQIVNNFLNQKKHLTHWPKTKNNQVVTIISFQQISLGTILISGVFVILQVKTKFKICVYSKTLSAPSILFFLSYNVVFRLIAWFLNRIFLLIVFSTFCNCNYLNLPEERLARTPIQNATSRGQVFKKTAFISIGRLGDSGPWPDSAQHLRW